MKKLYLIGMSLAGLLILGAAWSVRPVSAHAAHPAPVIAQVLCGDGSAADDYGFTYPLQQYHWTVDGEAYLTQDTIDELDTIFDELNDQSVVQTMILFKPASQVGNRVNCAVHFLRYMQLGLSDGERADNGFVFLIVVEDGAIDVHYGVGLGLPALTAHNLTELNRLAEDTYANTGSMDKAILTMAYSFANYAREQYPPLKGTGSTAASNPADNQTYDNQGNDSQPISIGLPDLAGMSITTLTCLCCISIIVLIVFLMIIRGLFRGGGGRGGWSGGGGFRPSNFGGGFSGWSGSSGRSSGGFRPSLPTRGGGGSGRSNRGN